MKDSKARVRCPFKDHDPDNPEYEKCGTFCEWCRLREHLLDRRHKPRKRCPTCGEIFADDVEWDLHTSARTCNPSRKALEKPFWVDRDQAAKIRQLSTRGRKNEGSIEDMYREVSLILFGSESAPVRTASAHPTWFPHVQHTDDSGVDHSRQAHLNELKQLLGNLPGLENIPEDDFVEELIDRVLSWPAYPRDETDVRSHESEAGEAAVNEQLGNNESEAQVPGISEPVRYTTGGPTGQLEHSLSNISTHPSSPGSLDPGQVSSVGHKLDMPSYGSGYVNPAQLQQSDAHHTPVPVSNGSFPAERQYPTSTSLPPGPAASQESEATIVVPSWDQILKDPYYANDGGKPDDLDNFDFSVEGFNPDVDSMQLSDGGDLDQQSEDWDVPDFVE